MCNNISIINNSSISVLKNSKLFYSEFEKLQLEMFRRGNLFFHITVNFFYLKNDNEYLLSSKNKKWDICYKLLVTCFIDLVFVDLVDFAMGTVENNADYTHPHCHILLICRAISSDLIGLKALILSKIDCSDIQVNHLKNQKDIQQAFFYVIKNLNNNHYAKLYMSLYSFINANDYYFPFFESIKQPNYIFYDPLNSLIIDIDRYTDPKYNQTTNLSGYLFDKQESPVYLILYYVSLYFQINDMFLYKGGLYKKKYNTLYSYEYLGDLLYLKNNIFNYLSELSNFLKSINLINMSKFYVLNIEQIIKKMHEISFFNKREINFNVIEFNDCIYFADYNCFIKKNNIRYDLSKLDIVTIRYYNYTYETISHRISKTIWAKKLRVQFNSKKEFNDFCAIFGAILFNFDLETKQKSLFLLGVSGAGKTSFVSNIATQAFGKQHTGSVDPLNLKFGLSTLVDKDIGIIDEIQYNKSIRSNLLKILSNENLIIDQKFKNPSFDKLTQNIIMSGNPSKELNDMLLDPAFQNRINLFLFNQFISISNQEKKQIENELPFILIHCARCYFNFKFNTTYKRRYLRQKYKLLLKSTNTLKLI